VTVVTITSQFVREEAPLYWNYTNQIRRAVGPNETVYAAGDGPGGTVRDSAGKYWDWWPTDSPTVRGPWKTIKIVPAT
jgi:hypothetical protein